MNFAEFKLSRTEKALLAVSIPATIWVGFVDPRSGSATPPCLFKLCTGFECPGCGTTRVVHDLLHFEFGRAVSTNLLAVVLLIVFAFASVRRVLTGSWIKRRIRIVEIFAAALIAVAFGILRNIPSTPFSYLAAG